MNQSLALEHTQQNSEEDDSFWVIITNGFCIMECLLSSFMGMLTNWDKTKITELLTIIQHKQCKVLNRKNKTKHVSDNYRGAFCLAII